MSFKAGDVVELKSGGPKMTVVGIVGEDPNLEMAFLAGHQLGDVAVNYFLKDRLEKGFFSAAALKLSED